MAYVPGSASGAVGVMGQAEPRVARDERRRAVRSFIVTSSLLLLGFGMVDRRVCRKMKWFKRSDIKRTNLTFWRSAVVAPSL